MAAGYIIEFQPGEEGEQALSDQLSVMLEALTRYEQANVKYKDNWRRMGWRGMLVRVRERAERLWDALWDKDPNRVPIKGKGDLDDAIDLINFACFLVRAVRDGNRDGSWWGRP